MKRKAPIVRQFMTRLPVELEQCETVAEAIRIMQQHQIRHLPVIRSFRLQGIVSQRDILEARVRHGDAVERMLLGDVCREDVLTVSPVDPVDVVARQMLDRKAGSAIVMDGGFVVGIFTSIDALRVLCDLFGQH